MLMNGSGNVANYCTLMCEAITSYFTQAAPDAIISVLVLQLMEQFLSMQVRIELGFFMITKFINILLFLGPHIGC